MKIDILTLFPEVIEAVLGSSIIGRGREKGLLDMAATNTRDYPPEKHGRTAVYP